MSAEPVVAVGQVWADCDKRQSGRRVRVILLGRNHAEVEVVAEASGSIRAAALLPVRRRRSISLDRFRPGSTGYRLVSP